MNTAGTEIEDSLKVMFSEDLWDGLLVEIEVAKAKLRLKFELEGGLNDAGEFFGSVLHSAKNGVNLLADIDPEMLAFVLVQYLPKSAFSSQKIVPRGLEFWPC